MKTIILNLSLLLTLVSCTKENENIASNDIINMQESMFSINLPYENKTIYITVESDNDTLYFYKFSDSDKTSLKLKVANHIIDAVKSNVLYHIQTKSLFARRNHTIHGNKVCFSLSQFNNKIEATYNSLGNYKDVSIKLDSLILQLKAEDMKISDFLN